MSKSSQQLLVGALLLALASQANAQTRIGNVTLSSPSTTSTAKTSKTKAAATPAISPDWLKVEGRITSPKSIILPKGSKVHVIIEDITVAGKPKEMLQISFKSARVPTSYHMYYNPKKYSNRHQYVLRASVKDASGRELYYSSLTTFNTKISNANIKLKVN